MIMAIQNKLLDELLTKHPDTEFVQLQLKSEAEKETIERVQEAIKEIPSIPCTACRYCAAGCPKHIAIPDIFEAMNMHLGWQNDKLAAELYEEATENGGRASDCIKCRRCERACPQQINITRYLEEIAAFFS